MDGVLGFPKSKANARQQIRARICALVCRVSRRLCIVRSFSVALRFRLCRRCGFAFLFFIFFFALICVLLCLVLVVVRLDGVKSNGSML